MDKPVCYKCGGEENARLYRFVEVKVDGPSLTKATKVMDLIAGFDRRVYCDKCLKKIKSDSSSRICHSFQNGSPFSILTTL